jgi:hypothetical protein
MVDLGGLDDLVKRPECDFCSLVVLGCQQNWLGAGTWEDAVSESIGATCRIDGLDIGRQKPEGYALQLTVIHSDYSFQWLEFEVVLDRDANLQKPSAQLGTKLTEKFSKVGFDILSHVVRSCEEKHYTDDRSNPIVSNEMFLIDLIEMRIVTSPAGE